MIYHTLVKNWAKWTELKVESELRILSNCRLDKNIYIKKKRCNV